MRRRRRSGAGRPRKPGMKRYANGRIVQCAENREAERGMSEREALSVGLAARKRHFGVTKSEARRATTGYLLGRLLELGRDPKHRAAGISLSRRHYYPAWCRLNLSHRARFLQIDIRMLLLHLMCTALCLSPHGK